jgi:hypothetical protein
MKGIADCRLAIADFSVMPEVRKSAIGNRQLEILTSEGRPQITQIGL